MRMVGSSAAESIAPEPMAALSIAAVCMAMVSMSWATALARREGSSVLRPWQEPKGTESE